MSLGSFIASKLPGWMRKSTYLHWSRLAEVLSFTYDLLVEGLYEGRLASMPGQTDAANYAGFESIDALGPIGRDRRIAQGELEPPEQYAARLRGWRVSHRRAGVGPWILAELQAVLRPSPPLVRYVTPAGRWWSRAADEGSFRFNTPEGDGFELAADGVIPNGGGALDANGAHQWIWGDVDPFQFFPIVYGPHELFDEPLTIDDPSWIIGSPGLTLGSTATPATVELVRSLVNQWRPAGVLPPVIIVAFDPASFDPLAPALTAGYPDDGDWSAGYKFEVDGDGDVVSTPTRLDTACYWIGKAPEEIP
jgi:hypothetical protein